MSASDIPCTVPDCGELVIGLHIDDAGRGAYLCREHYIARRKAEDPAWRVPPRMRP